MSNTTILILGIVAIAVGLFIGRRRRSREFSDRWPLYAKRLLNEREQVMYHRLRQTFSNHIVLTQVSMSQLVGVERAAPERQALANRFRQLTADFVLCTPAFQPLAVIELDGLSHDEPRRQDADKRKERAVRSAGLHFLRVNARSIPDAEQLYRLLPEVAAEPLNAYRPAYRGAADGR